MRTVRKGFLLFYLLNKRLMKRYSFLVILGMIPILTAGMFLAARGDSGVLHIMLCREKEGDVLAEQVIRDLSEQDSILRFSVENSAEKAYEAVRTGQADAVWMFSGDLQEKADAYTSGQRRAAPLVTVVEREDTVFLQLAREKLYSVLYPYLSYGLYKNYICMELTDGTPVSEEELREEYEYSEVTENIFQFSYRNTQDETGRQEETNYLLAPLRGLLALLVLLCGLTAALFYRQDREQKLFFLIPEGRKWFFPYIYHMTAVLDAAVVVLFTFCITHIMISWKRELPIMLLYCIACIGFSSLLGRICGNVQRLSTCIPILVLAMVVLCPIFISLRNYRMLQYLFPPFYYLQSIHNSHYIKYMLIYTVLLYGFDLVAGKHSDPPFHRGGFPQLHK